ncbi:3853_t:CDS:10 [Diversispora eburnea]|uniref:3853_t:CDS:1 n=1 Tax=Diversispora eburnea TaxID=1213867 RepID=A0A9N9AXU4_9GLOM|nr:3853_t:CDS:10 [Diversispora eburnea]
MSSEKKSSLSESNNINEINEISEINSSGGIKTSLDIQQMQSSYAKTYPLGDNPHGYYGSMMNFLGELCGTLGSIPLCCCFPNPYKSVDQGYVGLVSRFGQFYKSVDPGLVKVNVFTEKLEKVGVMIQVTNIPRQTIMTKPLLIDCIENREAIAFEIKEIIDEPAHSWGVKDIQFTQDLQSHISAAAKQKRIGESKVIAAKAEVDSAKFMREAAELLDSPTAMQMRYLETMDAMSKSSGAKVIFMPFNASNDGGSVPSTGSAIVGSAAD